jgi:hypothetical protein
MFTSAERSSRCERSGYTDISPNPFVSRSSPKSLAFRDSRSESAFVTLNTEEGKSNMNYLLLKARRLAATKTEFVVLQKAA